MDYDVKVSWPPKRVTRSSEQRRTREVTLELATSPDAVWEIAFARQATVVHRRVGAPPWDGIALDGRRIIVRGLRGDDFARLRAHLRDVVARTNDDATRRTRGRARRALAGADVHKTVVAEVPVDVERSRDEVADLVVLAILALEPFHGTVVVDDAAGVLRATCRGPAPGVDAAAHAERISCALAVAGLGGARVDGDGATLAGRS